MVIDHKFELHTQPFGSFPAQLHTFHENLKIIHHGTDNSVNGQFQIDNGMGFVNLQFGFGDRIIDTVVDVKLRRVFGTDPCAADIGFIGEDQCGGNGIDRDAGAFVMVADGGYDQ